MKPDTSTIKSETIAFLKDAFARAAVAHLVVDVQDIYCDPLHPDYAGEESEFPDNRRMADRVADFVSRSRDHAPPVWIAHVLPDSRHARALTDPDFAREFCRASLYRQNPAPDDMFLVKSHFSAFKGTSLRDILHRNGKDTLLVSGLYLSPCVSETYRGAMDNGCRAVILDDCVTDGPQTPLMSRNMFDRLHLSSREALDILKPPSPAAAL
jgi:nicotinamidase-related amidase